MSRLPCPVSGCIRTFKKAGDLTKHVNQSHKPLHSATAQPQSTARQDFDLPPFNTPSLGSPSPAPEPHPKSRRIFHPYLSSKICDEKGEFLPPDTPPPPTETNTNNWHPFDGEAQFRLADLLFRKDEMSQGNVDELLDIWSCFQRQEMEESGCDNCVPGRPFTNHDDMYNIIDSIIDGGAAWQCFQTAVEDGLPQDAPEWRKTSYQVWYRDPDTVIANILSNPEFSQHFDCAPYIHLDGNEKRHWADFMSGNLAWRHATHIYEEDASTKGAMLVPIILGADKTTVSVATGHVEYHPLYLSIGNITNAMRRAHRNAVIPIGFLAIPKCDCKYDNDSDFRVFKKRLYHTSIAAILQTLRPGMTEPVIRRCPDGHFQHIMYDLAAFIADYPEQVYLAGTVQGWCGRCTALASALDGPLADQRTRRLDQILREQFGGQGRVLWDNYGMDEHIIPFTEEFPRADIHEMLSPDLLHQIIKGCFKDMLVEWVIQYLIIEHGETRANEILDDIDRRLSVVPAFPGLRRFLQGRRYKQWTGDDSKALMKIFLPAVADYIPEEMAKCIAAFLDFCYLVRRSDIDETSLKAIETSLSTFIHYRDIFSQSGVREHFSIPRMHSMIHYPFLVVDFASPNGLCSSITESRHITAVKKPWRRSNRYKALSQILLTNQRLDKLSALRSLLVERNLLNPLRHPQPDLTSTENKDVGPVDSGRALADVKLARNRASGYPRFIAELAAHIKQPSFETLTQEFLLEQLTNSDDNAPNNPDIPLPEIVSRINVYHSATALFFAPSDQSGVQGMKRERIRCNDSWYGNERCDCVLVTIDEDIPGFRGLSVARVLLFFSFEHEGTVYPCALIHWFNTYGQRCDRKTGMWMVRPAFRDQARQNPCLAVVHLDALIRSVHLIPVFGSQALPADLQPHHSLNVFKTFYVNKYADHHANEILF
ncbi:hypothetical protein EV360DRAFT_57070 [Lentinula raphanica]|nr:hypothetical protein EV360DRAFT_57070 [Lentinula raphanica]